MFHTCSRRVGSANRNCAGIDFPIIFFKISNEDASMEYLIGLIFLIFMLLVDSRLNKIHKELVQLNRGLAYLASAVPHPEKPEKTPKV